MSSFKLKLDMAVQNLKGLNRREVQTKRALDVVNEKTDRITSEIAKFKEQLTALAHERISLNETLQGVVEYKDEVNASVTRLFWEQHAESYPSYLDDAQKAVVLSEYLKKQGVNR